MKKITQIPDIVWHAISLLTFDALELWKIYWKLTMENLF